MIGALLVVAGLAQAAGAPGVIEGIVSAQQTLLPLAGAEIVVTDTSARQVAKAASGADGRFSIPNLLAGQYHVAISMRGFSTATVDVSVGGGLTADASAALTVAETIRVVASSEVLTAGEALAPAESMASRELDQYAPGAGFQSAVRQFASVMATQTGLNIKGGRPNQAGVQLGALTLVDPASGVAHVPLPDGAIDSVTVLPSPYGTEYGRFSSGVVVIDPRRAGDAWRYQIGRATPIVRNARGQFLRFHLDDFRPRFAVGGPLVRDRLFVQQGGQVRYASTDVPSRPEDELRVLKSLSSFTRLDAKLSERHSLTGTFGVFPAVTSFATLGTFTPPDATVDLRTFVAHAAVTERARWGLRTLSATTVQWLPSQADADPQGPAPMVMLPETTAGNFFNRQRRRSTTVQFVETVTTEIEGAGARHFVKAGVDLLASRYDGTSDSRSVLIQRNDASLARRLDYAGATTQSVTGTDVAVFASDRIQLNDRWDVEFGGRIDRDGIIDRVNVTPRAGTAIRLLPSGRAVLRGGAGLFFGRTPFTVGAFQAFPGALDTRYGGDGVTPIAPAVPFAPTTAAQETARSRTWDLGIELRPDGRWTFHATAIGRDGQNELIVSPVTAGARGEWRLSSDGRSSYRDVEIGAQFTRGSTLDVQAQYDWSSARGDLNALATLFDTVMAPIVGANDNAPLPADVPHRFFLRARMLPAPRWLFLGVFDWRSGSPYSTVNEMLDFVGPRSLGRFPVYTRLEVGFEHRVELLNFKPWVGVRATNVFNASLPADVQANLGSPNYGRFYNSEDRHVRLQLRFER